MLNNRFARPNNTKDAHGNLIVQCLIKGHDGGNWEIAGNNFSGKLPDVSTTLAGKPMLFFGNLALSSVIVERQQQTVIAISRDRALDADQVLIRGVRREDIVNHDVGDANTRGPIAMLVGTT